MRNFFNAVCLLVTTAVVIGFGTSLSRAQSAPAPSRRTLDLSVNYAYLHANAPAGGCGCFSMNGGAASVAVGLTPSLSLVLDFGRTHAGNILNSNETLTLFTYVAGPRYTLRNRLGRIDPFAEILLGGAHSSSNFVYNNGGNGFAMLAGGGADIALSHHVSLRAVEIAYLLTRIPNGSTNSQNNLSITTGVVYRFDRK